MGLSFTSVSLTQGGSNYMWGDLDVAQSWWLQCWPQYKSFSFLKWAFSFQMNISMFGGMQSRELIFLCLFASRDKIKWQSVSYLLHLVLHFGRTASFVWYQDFSFNISYSSRFYNLHNDYCVFCCHSNACRSLKQPSCNVNYICESHTDQIPAERARQHLNS